MSRTILAPLTTTFTPPAACSTYGAVGTAATAVPLRQAQSCSSGSLNVDRRCWPSVSLQPREADYGRVGFFSPGLYCPSGYSSACTGAMLTNGSPSPLSIGTSFKFIFPLSASETAIGCCPQGLTCSVLEDGFQTCATIITTGQVTGIIGFCGLDVLTSYEFSQSFDIGTKFSLIDTLNTEKITLSSALLYAPLIQIVYRSIDISGSFDTITTTTSTVALATTTLKIYPSSDPTTSETNSTGLSAGAKIALGVGIPLAIILLVAIIAFIFFRRRRRRRMTHPQTYKPVSSTTLQAPIDNSAANTYNHDMQHAELYVSPAAEAANTQRGFELGAVTERSPAELPTKGGAGMYLPALHR